MDDKELPEQLIIDDHQNGLHNQKNEEDGRQDWGNPEHMNTLIALHFQAVYLHIYTPGTAWWYHLCTCKVSFDSLFSLTLIAIYRWKVSFIPHRATTQACWPSYFPKSPLSRWLVWGTYYIALIVWHCIINWQLLTSYMVRRRLSWATIGEYHALGDTHCMANHSAKRGWGQSLRPIKWDPVIASPVILHKWRATIKQLFRPC